MKIQGVDVAMKQIRFELDGQDISITFHNSFLQGITDVSVFVGLPDAQLLSKKSIKVKRLTGSLAGRVKETVSILVLRGQCTRKFRNSDLR